MPDLFPATTPDLRQQIEEVQRELRQRERVYPRLVNNGTLRQERADHQIACMRAVLTTLEFLAAGER